MENDKEFLEISKGMVSNEKLVREENLEKMKRFVHEKVTNNEFYEFYFTKIWKSMFYFFWNADKPVYQKAQAEKVAKFFDYIETDDIEKYHVWIKCFLIEFIKKWQKIDFLRTDKYIMFTQTIIKIYFDYNLKNNPHKDSLKIFDFIVLAIKCGHYNFSFVSTVLNSVSYIIDEFFKDDNFKNSLNDEFFCNFTDKLVSLFLVLRDKREINNFKENLFNRIDNIMIKDPFYANSDLKKIYQRKIFEKATSKDEIPENQRSILFKVYKKIKYNDENYEQKEIEKVKTYDVDPVNDYILKKVYSNRTRMSKIEKLKMLSDKRKFLLNNQKQLAQMEKEKYEKLKKEINKDLESKTGNSVILTNGEKTDDPNHVLTSNDVLKKKNNEKNKNANDINKDENKKKACDNKIKESLALDQIDCYDPNEETFINENNKTSNITNKQKEEILEENIIRMDEEEENNENKKEIKESKKKPLDKNGKNINGNKNSIDSKQRNISKGKDSEDKELEENDCEEYEEMEDLENEEAEDFEELEYDDGEEFEFYEDDEDDLNEDFEYLSDEEEEESDLIEDDMFKKSLKNIYAKINNNPLLSKKDKKNGAPVKTQEDLETQKSLVLARNNSIKNAMLKTSSNIVLLGKKRNKGLLHSTNTNNNNNNNNNPHPLRKNSGNLSNKKKVGFTLSRNIVNKYEQQKPITLTSNKKNVEVGKNLSPLKGSLKKKNKLN